MPKIEDLIGKTPKKQDQSEDNILIDGSFSCQVCGKVVDEAEMQRTTGTILWKCSEGHESKVTL